MFNILFKQKLSGIFYCCCREKSVLTPHWNCLYGLLSIAFVIINVHNGLSQRILPLCPTIKLKCLCSETCPLGDGRNKEINTSPCLKFAILGGICKINGLFTLCPHLLPSLIHKRSWHSELGRKSQLALWL